MLKRSDLVDCFVAQPPSPQVGARGCCSFKADPVVDVSDVGSSHDAVVLRLTPGVAAGVWLASLDEGRPVHSQCADPRKIKVRVGWFKW